MKEAHPRKWVLCLSLVFAVSATPAGSGEWPQYRGPNRDAVSAEQGLLEEWPAKGPEVVWRIPIGEGFSSVSVAGGRLYTLWDEGDGEYLVALEAGTGKELWRYRVDVAFASNWGNGPRSTPAVDGDKVFAVSAQGKLYAVSTADGQPIWRHDLAREYGATIPAYGYASSPMTLDDKLLVEVGGESGHAFIAFDPSSGTVLWASQSDAAAYSSPLAITVDGVRQVVFLSASGLFSLAPSDGRLLWKHPWSPSCPSTGIPTNVAHPVFIPPDRIFLSSGYGTLTGSAVVRILRRGDVFATETVWRSEEMRNVLNSSLLRERSIYGFDGGILKAIDAASGETRWKARGFERGSLIAAGDQLIVLGEHGQLALVEATSSGYRERGSMRIFKERSWTAPALADGRLYLRNQSEMTSLDLRSRSGEAESGPSF